MVSRLERAAQRERAALVRGDAESLARLARAWRLARGRIDARVHDLAPTLAAEPTPARVRADERFRALAAQIDDELRHLGALTARETAARQADLVATAGESARRVVEAQSARAAASFALLPREAVRDLVGVLADGTPVAEAVGRRFGAFAAEAKDELVASLAEGVNPTETARRLSALGDGFASRHVLTLARTETLRAYRAASLRTMAANADVLDGWVWLADLSDRTCLACLNMHGRTFPLTRQWFAAHPNCRCSPAPVVKGLRLPPIESGEDWFGRQDPVAQERQMGAARYAAWRAGDAGFGDFLGTRRDATWGPSVYERSLREVEGTRERRAA